MRLGLGSWRLFLALMVVISHLYASMIGGPAAYAVWGFFVLSGYLMTLTLTTKYRTDLKAYAVNRFVRIYPPYIAAVLLGLATIAVLHSRGVDPAQLNPQFTYPTGVENWLSVIGMIPFLPQPGLPVPVASALFVEVFAYTIMPLFARSKSAAWLGFILAFVANYGYGFGVDSFIPRYCGVATGMLPFAAGALLCHYRANLKGLSAPALSVAAWCAHAVYGTHDTYWPWTYGLLMSVVLSAWVVLSLADVKAGALDKWTGDLSYPVYLLHTTVAGWLIPHYGYGRAWPFFVASFVATLVVSWLFVVLIDRPLAKMKRGAITPRAPTLHKTEIA